MTAALLLLLCVTCHGPRIVLIILTEDKMIAEIKTIREFDEEKKITEPTIIREVERYNNFTC